MGNRLKLWNGSAWEAVEKFTTFDGSSWWFAAGYYWNGAAWIPFVNDGEGSKIYAQSYARRFFFINPKTLESIFQTNNVGGVQFGVSGIGGDASVCFATENYSTDYFFR